MIFLFGASDDCIEIEGDIRDEFYLSSGDKDYVAFSNGVVASISYDGDWNIGMKSIPHDIKYEVYPAGSQKAIEVSGRDFTDVLAIDEPTIWVVCGPGMVKAFR